MNLDHPGLKQAIACAEQATDCYHRPVVLVDLNDPYAVAARLREILDAALDPDHVWLANDYESFMLRESRQARAAAFRNVVLLTEVLAQHVLAGNFPAPRV